MSRYLVMFALLFSPALAWTQTAEHWTVTLADTHQIYLCDACALRAPFPDYASKSALDEWKTSQPPFKGPVDEDGVLHKIKNGDHVTLCNNSGCSTYIWESPAGWGDGVFQKTETHGDNGSGWTD